MPWEVLEEWTWERIAIMLDCLRDEAKIESRGAKRTRADNVTEMSEEQFLMKKRLLDG